MRQVIGDRVEQKFLIGLDLGQVNDPTGLVILDRMQAIKTELVSYSWHDPLLIDGFENKEVVSGAFYHARHIERLPLGASYPAIVAYVKRMISTPEIDGRYKLVIDQTGVGRPVFDMFKAAGLDAVGVTITGGDGISKSGANQVRVAKRLLVSTVQVVMQQGRLKIAKSMAGVEALQQELLNFRVKITDSANDLYAAREGEHDDLVIAMALALWFGERYGDPPAKAEQVRWKLGGLL